MTTTVLCTNCGTRNQAALGHCRRCKEPLSGKSLQGNSTMRGTPTSELIGERWALIGQAQQLGSSWTRGRDVATGQDVYLLTLAETDVPGLDRRQLMELARRRQDIRSGGLTKVMAVHEKNEGVVSVFSFADGRPLSRMVARRSGLPLSVALHFFENVVAGIDALHDHGLVHGGLEPNALWISDEGPSGVPAATLLGGIRPFSPEEAMNDYRGLARLLASMVLGDEHSDFRGAAEVIGAAIHRVERGYGESHASAIRQLFDVLVRADDGLAQRRRPMIEDAVHGLDLDDHHRMMPVSRGPFLRGSSDDDPDARPEEMPSAMVDVGAFFIDRTPVTARQFHRYLQAQAKTPPPGWSEVNCIDEGGDLPVVFITWEEAAAYAKWAGKRLPTEAEWEKAARGTDGRIYPWGMEAPTSDLAWYGGKDGPERVGGRRQGQSVFGVLDMAGNVFEWVLDWFDADYYTISPLSDPAGPDRGSKKVLRGGSFVHPPFALRCATRGRYAPGERRTNHSFRCVWSLRDPS